MYRFGVLLLLVIGSTELLRLLIAVLQGCQFLNRC